MHRRSSRASATQLDANNYSTALHGVKHKLAHERADKTDWSAKTPAQCRRLIAVLKDAIAELEQEAAGAARPAAAKRSKRAEASRRKSSKRAAGAAPPPAEESSTLAAAE